MSVAVTSLPVPLSPVIEHRAVAVADDAQELEHRAHPRALADDDRVHG